MIDIEDYLNGFYRGTKDPSLEAMKYFINEYDDFEKKMKFIHIAGTNGKGSCTEIISNILIKQGYKVGKFLSPHLIKYNERISVNEKEISDKEMSDLIEELQPKIDKYNNARQVKITLFELETTMALLYFYRKNVDFVVLETGLGGLYDCTNVITNPLVSIITSIGYDHMNILGNTLPEIAYQKAGIIKENSNTVIFEQSQEINNVFINQCEEKNNRLHIVKNDKIANYNFDDKYQYFDYENMSKLSINLKGKIQIQNASICIETIKILNNLGFIVSEESIREGLRTVIHRGRMEVLNEKPLIIYDGAHNEPAIRNLQNMVDMYYNKFKRVYIISILKRKDYDEMLRLLSQDEEGLFVLTSGNDPETYASGKELYDICIKYKKNNIYMKSLEDAIKYAMNSDVHTANFVIGSFYTYGTVTNIIKEIKNDRNKECKL